MTTDELKKLGEQSNRLVDESLSDIVNRVRDEHVFALHASLQRAVERHRSNEAMVQYLNVWKIQLGLDDFEGEYDKSFKKPLVYANQLSPTQRREMNDSLNRRKKHKKKK